MAILWRSQTVNSVKVTKLNPPYPQNPYIKASGINDTGLVVGEAYFQKEPNTRHAFVGDANSLADLAGVESWATSINNLGQVAGSSYGQGGERAFVCDANGKMTDLGTLPGGRESWAYGINNLGQVAGASTWPGGGEHAFVGDAKGLTDLGTLGGPDSVARGINDTGQVVGWSSTCSGGGTHAFFKDANDKMTNLGTLPGGSESWAYDINKVGQVVGSSTWSGGGKHAFVGDANGLTDLGALGGSNSEAKSINDSGQVVGWASLAGDATFHAFVWENGIMYDLNKFVKLPPDEVLVEAYINNASLIVANSNRGNTYLLTPTLVEMTLIIKEIKIVE